MPQKQELIDSRSASKSSESLSASQQQFAEVIGTYLAQIWINNHHTGAISASSNAVATAEPRLEEPRPLRS
jgi:hypothetical protein